MNLPRFAVSRPVMTAVIFIVMIVFGMLSLKMLPLDLFPEIEPPAISVVTVYSGAGAKEIEEKVSKPIENALASVGDLKDLRSTSQEGMSQVVCLFEFGTNLDEAANNIRDKLEFAKQRLPDDAEQPMVIKFNLAMFPIMFLSLTSDDVDIRGHEKEIENLIIEPLQRIPGVASVIAFNIMNKEVAVTVDQDRLTALNLSIADISNAIRMDNYSLPAGHMEIGSFDYTIRVPGEYDNIKHIEDTIIAATPAGLVRIRDVARVFWSATDTRQVSTLNDREMVFLMVQKQSGSNTVKVASSVNKKISDMEGKLPFGMKLTMVMDSAEFILNMVGNLTRTVYFGGFFVLLVVIFFLRRLRSSIIIATSIPASLIIGFAFLYSFGYTLNMISLMALSLAIGMVVDNSIVVLDSISQHISWGKNRRDAAITGTVEVGGAIMASTLTTVMIFAPLFFIGGFVGIMFKQLAGVVILTLFASLLSALLLTPMLCSRLLKPVATSKEEGRNGNGYANGNGNGNGLKYTLIRTSENIFNTLETRYSRTLNWTLKHRVLTLGIAAVIFISSLGLVKIIGVDFMPSEDSGDIQISFETPLGTRIEETEKVAQAIADVVKEHIPERRYVYYRCGESGGGMSGTIQGTSTGRVGVKTLPLNQRDRSTQEMGAVIRPYIEKIPGIYKLDIAADNPMSSMFSGGQKPVTIQVLCKDVKKAEKIADEMLVKIEKIKGLKDITTDTVNLKPELQVSIDRTRANQIGLNVYGIADAVRGSMFGRLTSIYREGGNEYDIYVRLRKQDRMTVQQLENMELKTMTGETVPLKTVATISEGMTPLSISRLNKQRVLTIGARNEGATLGEIQEQIDTIIAGMNIPPDVGIEYGGNLEQQADVNKDMSLLLLMGIFLVYLVMAAQFESFVDPLVIIFSIPFAATGVMTGLFIAGFPLSVPAMLGMIILVGIVVNNAIVLVDYTNILRRTEKMGVIRALKTAGKRRLRPVLMTALTTISGMTPLALSQGDGHESWQPMGISVVFGLLVSTLVTLVVIPVMYAMAEPLRRKIHDVFGNEEDDALPEDTNGEIA